MLLLLQPCHKIGHIELLTLTRKYGIKLNRLKLNLKNQLLTNSEKINLK